MRLGGFACEGGCGYEGSFEQVSLHEQRCPALNPELKQAEQAEPTQQQSSGSVALNARFPVMRLNPSLLALSHREPSGRQGELSPRARSAAKSSWERAHVAQADSSGGPQYRGGRVYSRAASCPAGLHKEMMRKTLGM